ncbi:MAG: amidohydrolase [Gammaproteobacteria bacterium]|nr:amidohydrolase [Gammaproteobacteria bacterium]
MKFRATALALLSSLALPVQAANQVLEADIAADYTRLEALYTHFHRHPELSFQEKDSAQIVAKELKKLGFSVTTGLGGHGVVAQMRNGEGPTLMLRSDMDALPVLEQTGLPYASKVKAKNDQGLSVPVMHACGHDVHMTVLLGTAKQLVARKAEWRGTLVLIGQPAEERSGGAIAMLNQGLFRDHPKPDFNLAIHTSAAVPAGSLAYTEGYAFANTDSVDITVRGLGGHGAYPHKTKDPIVLAAGLVMAFQTIVSRETAPQEAAVVTVGSIHGGAQHNIIPDEVKLQLTLRSYSPAVREHSLAALKRISENYARAAGLPENLLPIVTLKNEGTPAVWNDPALTRRLVGVFERELGKDKVAPIEPTMAGEDFARYGQTEDKIPGLIFWVGGVDPVKYAQAKAKGTDLPALHSPFFAPLPEPTLKTGVQALTSAALELLGKP